MPLFAAAQQILKTALGQDAVFREGQWEAISAVVIDRKRLVVVQRTGWGKSLVYFIATRLNRKQKQGMTVLVSPLLSLMRNQIEQAARFGLAAARIDSTNTDEHAEITQWLLNDEIDLLIISPERLANATFRSKVWGHIQHRIGLLVVDEVHCISDWGHDFRPDYRRVISIVSEMPAQTAVLGTTATANTRVIQDVRAILGGDVAVSRGSLMRSSLQLYVYPEIQTAAQRLVLLSHLLRSIKGTGIIYCATTRDCELVAGWLRSDGFEVEAYHAKLDGDREDLERKLLNNEVKALVASVALGMGFDKPDLSFVIHYQLPGSIISYYQQIGRAGRGIDNAYIVLMRGEEDREIQEYFINNAFPRIDTLMEVAQALRDGQVSSSSDIQAEYNLRKTTADKILQHLEIEGFVRYNAGGYEVTGQPLPDFDRWHEVTEQRYRELAQMEDFAETQGCLMQFLAHALEDPTHPAYCGRCKNCRSSQSKFVATQEQLIRAESFLLKGDPILIEPRKQWARRGMITDRAKLEHTNEEGMALTYYNSEGWGKLVKKGKYTDQHFDDALVNAAAEVILRRWAGQIAWVTNIPSTRHPQLVPSFAQRLAKCLHLPYLDAVRCVQHYPEQKTMQNSQKQLENIAKAFEIAPSIPTTPALLVDDIIDSGWSLTMAGWLLRENGVAKVFPFVLARAVSGQ